MLNNIVIVEVDEVDFRRYSSIPHTSIQNLRVLLKFLNHDQNKKAEKEEIF